MPSTSWPRRAPWPSCSPRPGRSGAARGQRRTVARAGDRLDYATREHAGKPHKGKITDTEKVLVREHLDEINERLAGQGLRVISLTDPEHIERYGLQDLARERNLELEFGLSDDVDAEDRLDAKVA